MTPLWSARQVAPGDKHRPAGAVGNYGRARHSVPPRRCLRWQWIRSMKTGVSYKGTVKNGVVVLPLEAQLPDGAEVEVTPLEARTDDPPFLRAILKLAKPRDWPGDFALNHVHYAKGHPKKS